MQLTTNNIDNFYIRHSIFKSIKASTKYFNGNLLDAGCGKMPYKDYLLNNSNINKYTSIDIENALSYDKEVAPDYRWDGVKMPFKDCSFDTVFATEVLEHCDKPQVFIDECHRVLVQDGILFFTVPFLWPLHETPHDEFRYTPYALERLLTQSGFSNIIINALGGWNDSLAVMLGLWGKRYLLGKKSTLICPILKVIVKYLISNDKVPLNFSEGTMITGLYGIVRK